MWWAEAASLRHCSKNSSWSGVATSSILRILFMVNVSSCSIYKWLSTLVKIVSIYALACSASWLQPGVALLVYILPGFSVYTFQNYSNPEKELTFHVHIAKLQVRRDYDTFQQTCKHIRNSISFISFFLSSLSSSLLRVLCKSLQYKIVNLNVFVGQKV